jgi:HD-GYP domain-containing protein (c-di-GMP phosphodiesterase class II)
MADIALSQVIGSLSYALDIVEGQPPGHALRSCLIGMRLAEELELDSRTRSDLFYALLLKDAGCSANSSRMSAIFASDDIAAKRTSKLVNWSDGRASAVWAIRTAAAGDGVRKRVQTLRAMRGESEITRQFMEARCDRGAEIARMLFLSEPTAIAIRSLDEHWDGCGMPDGLAGEEIPFAARVLCLAQTAEVFHRNRGIRAARDVAKQRRGTWFDPALVDVFLGLCEDRSFWATLDAPDVSPWEPRELALAADEQRLDRIAEAFARVIDAKSPFTASHSVRVAEIAVGVAAVLGFGAQELRTLNRAALLHDIGKLAISNRILDKPARLTGTEFAKIKEHPLISERILARVPGSEHLAPLAGAHHERLDGSGYPRGLVAHDLTTPMRLLAVADVYEALTSERPYRPAFSSDEAMSIIRSDVPERFDREAFAVLRRLLAGDATAIDASAEPPAVLRAQAVFPLGRE